MSKNPAAFAQIDATIANKVIQALGAVVDAAGLSGGDKNRLSGHFALLASWCILILLPIVYRKAGRVGVTYIEDDRSIGEAAKNQATINPSQTLFDVKRLIGRRFKDSTVQTRH